MDTTIEGLRQSGTLEGAQLFGDAIGLRLAFTKLGIARKRSAADITTDADPDLVRVGADILESDAYDAIVRADNEVRAWVRQRSGTMPLFGGGAHLVKLARFEEIGAYVRNYRDNDRPILVDAFLAEYDTKAEEGRAKLKSLARANEYPPLWQVRRSFAVRIAWFELGAPGSLRKLSDEAYAAAADTMRAEFDRALEAGRAALRIEWLGIVDRLADRLSPGADGARKRFTGTLTENAREFIALFRDRDFTDDRQLADLLARADGLLSGVDVEILKSDDVARARTAEGFTALRAELDKLIPRAGRVYGDD